MRTAFFCVVCGAPFRLCLLKGTYKMRGQRGGNLCVCWEKVSVLCAEEDFAAGAPQDHYGMFLDFVAMWLAGYPRSPVVLELEGAGAGVCAC